MATAVKNGSTKKATTANVQLKEKLAKEAAGTTQKTTPQPPKEEVITLDERIAKFKKLQGLNNQRDRLVSTLESLANFNLNQDFSSTFLLRDSAGLEFKTNNSNLIQLVANGLQTTLEQRKNELEKQILEFEF